MDLFATVTAPVLKMVMDMARPTRRWGWCGTPEGPLLYRADEKVPWWLFAWVSTGPVKVRFGGDAYVYFDGEQMVVERVGPDDRTPYLIIENAGDLRLTAYGAPTAWRGPR